MEESRTYTINEAAGLTGLHKNTIRQRIRLGQLRATIRNGKFGEEYRIEHAALVESGLLPDTGPLDGPGEAVLDAEFTAAGNGAEAPAAADSGSLGALSELYQRHEQAMFRLGYMQSELDRVKALAESAESLRQDNEQQRREVQTLRETLETAERQATEVAAQAQELETLRRSVEHLKSLTEEQERVIAALDERARRPWWRVW